VDDDTIRTAVNGGSGAVSSKRTKLGKGGVQKVCFWSDVWMDGTSWMDDP